MQTIEMDRGYRRMIILFHQNIRILLYRLRLNHHRIHLQHQAWSTHHADLNPFHRWTRSKFLLKDHHRRRHRQRHP